jgi:acyl-CoA synthetase (AMP-forming)/AMP-acid ligase II
MPSVENAHTIPQLLAHAALTYADSPAIDDDGRLFSYRELDQLRQQAARALLALEVQAGDRVAIWAPNIWEWIVAACALHSVGAVLVPLNTRMKGAEAAFVLRESGASLLFSISEFLDIDYPRQLAGEALPALQRVISLRGSAPGCLGWEDFIALAAEVAPIELQLREATVTPQSLSDLLFTSGSTG